MTRGSRLRKSMPCVSVRQECQRSRSSSTNPKSGSIPMTLVLSGWWKSGANAPRTTGRMQLLEASLPPRCLAPGGCEGSRHLAERVCPRHGGVTSWPCQPTGPRRRRGRRRPEGSSVSSSPPPTVGSLRACRHESHGIGPVPSSPTVLERADTADTAEGAPASGSPLASSSCDPVSTGADGSGVRARERVVVASARHIGAGTCEAVETVMAARP